MNSEPAGGIKYDVPDTEYRASAGISKSDLDLIDISPAHYHQHEKQEPTPQMILGTLTHHALLLKGNVKTMLHVKPEDFDGRTTDGKNWVKSHSDKPIISHDDYQNMIRMAGAVWAHPKVSAFLDRSKTEVSFWRPHPIGVMTKGRPDIIGPDASGAPCIADIKTVGHGDGQPEEFLRKVLSFRYHVQAAYYVDGMAQIMSETHAFVFIVVERECPWAVSLFALDESWIEAGRRAYSANLETYKRCLESGVWPAYPEDVQVLNMPAWAQRQNLLAYQRPLAIGP